MTWEQRGGTKVWAGMLPDDERHGTPAGYHAHWRAGEPACLGCCEAVAAHNAEGRAERAGACDGCGSPLRADSRGSGRCRSCSNRRAYCKRRHPRTPDNVDRQGRCLPCKREYEARGRESERVRRIEQVIVDRWTGASSRG